MDTNSTYCVYCKPGKDKTVAIRLECLGYESLSPLQSKPVYVDGKKEVRTIRLMPGYVFFFAHNPEWEKINALDSVVRVLQYGDGERALRDNDLNFIHWLREIDGVLSISPVACIGTRIRVIDGPLKHYEGQIVDVNKRRERVAVEISKSGLLSRIWFPIEYIDTLDVSNTE